MRRPGLPHGLAVERRTIAYVRVSSHDQMSDRARLKQVTAVGRRCGTGPMKQESSTEVNHG